MAVKITCESVTVNAEGHVFEWGPIDRGLIINQLSLAAVGRVRPLLDEPAMESLRRYPTFHKDGEQGRFPFSEVLGRHDPYFTSAGTEAFRRDNPNAAVQFIETGHFALEMHLEEIASAMRRFLAR